jgi:hypothetical protein
MPKKSKLTRRDNGSSSRSRKMVVPRSVHPPMIRSNVCVRHKYRFFNGVNSGTFTISNNDILGAAGVMCSVTNNTCVAIFSSFRIRSVDVWAAAQTAANNTAVNTIAINWNGGPVFVANEELSDTSISPDFPPYIHAVPPKNSNASFWQTSTTAGIFTLTLCDQAIVDLDVDLIMSDQQDTLSITGFSTAVLGAQYYLALDGRASNLLVPQSLSTTA